MLYSELNDLTKGECTAKEYAVVNAAYMASDDMTKEEAARLWHFLYAKKHKEAAREKLAKQHSIEYLSTLYPGHVESIKGLGTIFIERGAGGNDARLIYLNKGTIATGLKLQYLATITASGHRVAEGNPGKLTFRGSLIE